jgi:hypothetical protein
MKKQIHFMSGVPRSGSTVLAAILNQNKQTHVSTTSGVVFALDALANVWHSQGLLGENDKERTKLSRTMGAVFDTFYEDVEEPVIIDKGRGWPIPTILSAMTQVLGEKPKIVATVRSIPDCMASFVRVAKPDDLDEFIYSEVLSTHLKAAYISLQTGYEFAPECFCIVEYEDLVADPKAQLDRIHEFLDLPDFDYDFTAIDGTSVQEDDEELHHYAGMHDIQPVLAKQHNEDPKDVLKHHYTTFCQPEFWLDKPRTTPELHDLDLQLTASRMGNFTEGWRLSRKLEQDEPNNHRAAYNRGWYLLRQGEIQKGYQLMDRGRIEGVFGNTVPDLPTRPWDGKTKGTVLLYLEGGLGDQIHQVRYAKPIAERGCKVIVCCSGQLASLFVDVEGVSSVVQHEACFGTYHDFYVQGMSAVVPLGFELEDLSGTPYIAKPKAIRGFRKRIGLRWQGQSMFEHEHHKKFPYELMFNAVKGVDADFISLQRDEAVEECPPWVEKVPLNTWEDTRQATASCDLVISSCTSVSHLAAAMGVETWVVTPVMPYFLYAQEGDTCPYYDTMKLMRQETFGDWKAPFARIRKSLSEKKQALRSVK